MKMGAGATQLVFLSLLLYVASAWDGYVPVANDAQNRLVADSSIDLEDLVKAFRDPVEIFEDELPSSFEGSSTEFSRSCLEISRRAKAFVNDQSLIDEIDSLASTLCHALPPELEGKLMSNDTCTTCRNILDSINGALGDTEQQLAIIVYLLKACEIQTVIDQCKKFVFAFGPIVISGLQTIVSKDICYMVHICEDAKNQTTNMTMWDIGNPQLNLQSINLGDLSDLI